MEKFTQEQRKLLENNPNIQAVLSTHVLYTKEFKEKALTEYALGKSASQIFDEAGIDVSFLSSAPDYASKILSKWRLAKSGNNSIHYPKKKPQKNRSAYQKLLERNEYLEAENEFLKKLQALNNMFRE